MAPWGVELVEDQGKSKWYVYVVTAGRSGEGGKVVGVRRRPLAAFELAMAQPTHGAGGWQELGCAIPGVVTIWKAGGQYVSVERWEVL
jgi:hypothetical protein